MKQIAISASHLTKTFGDFTAVNDVSFNIFEGEIVGILGPNGAGKTTTLRLLTGLFKLEEGEKGEGGQVKIFDDNLTDHQIKCKIKFGIVPEISNAHSDFTVLQNLDFSGKLYGLSKKDIKLRSQLLLARFGLIDKSHAKTKTLSKGLKQRANLCLALLHEPSILILDEPTNGLDPFSIKIMRNQILDFNKAGKTILITTHDMKEAQTICDRILIMNKGKIIADASPDTLRKNFKSLSTIIFKAEKESESTLIHFPSLTKRADGGFALSSDNVSRDVSELYNVLTLQHQIQISDVQIEETSLEEVFIDLINKDSLSKKIEGKKND